MIFNKKSFIFLIVIFSLAESVYSAKIVQKQFPLTGLGGSRWEVNVVPVCWENYLRPTPINNYSNGVKWTREAVEETWEKYSLIDFVGWGKCNEYSHGIRIQIKDTGPHVKKIGNGLDGLKNGMVLNFTFNSWSSSCKQRESIKYCIKTIAVHEFGHALGFTHEQNRSDAPNECRRENMQGTVGDIPITRYDLDSVMNYCNPRWGGDGRLSKLDIAGLQEWYNNSSKYKTPSWSVLGTEEWRIESDNNYIYSGHKIKLRNNNNSRYITYGSRSRGINLKWAKTKNKKNSDVQIIKHTRLRDGNSPSRLYDDDKVAIKVSNKGYLTYKPRKYGINLVWSKKPSYEWKLIKWNDNFNAKNTPIKKNTFFGLYNMTIGDYIVNCKRKNGINLKWTRDCSSSSSR